MIGPNNRYYFDANALWKFYRYEKGALEIRRLVSNSPQPILISSLTRLEFMSVLMKYFRQDRLKRRTVKKLVERLIRDTRSGTKNRPFLITSWPDYPFQQAESLLVQYADRLGIGSNDSLHLAIVSKLQISFPNIIMVTSDAAIKEVCQRLNMAHYDPEINP